MDSSACLNLLEVNLRPVEARYDSDARRSATGCLEGTRADILKQLNDWIFSTNSAPVHMFCLFGQVGTGKLAITHTICELHAASGHLGASFFFSQDQKDLTDRHRLQYHRVSTRLLSSQLPAPAS